MLFIDDDNPVTVDNSPVNNDYLIKTGWLDVPIDPVMNAYFDANSTYNNDPGDSDTYTINTRVGDVCKNPGQSVLVLVLSYRDGSTTPSAPTLSDGEHTFTQIANQVILGTGGDRYRMNVFRTEWHGAAFMDDITIDYAGQLHNGYIISLIPFTGIDDSGTNGSAAFVQAVSAAGTSGPVTATLAAFANSNNNTLLLEVLLNDADANTPNDSVAPPTDCDDLKFTTFEGSDVTFGPVVVSIYIQLLQSVDTTPTGGTLTDTVYWGCCAIELGVDLTKPDCGEIGAAYPAASQEAAIDSYAYNGESYCEMRFTS